MGIFFAIIVIIFVVGSLIAYSQAKSANNAETAKKKSDINDEIKKITSQNQSTASLLQTASEVKQSATLSKPLSADEKAEASAQAKRELLARLAEYKAHKEDERNTTRFSHSEAHSDIVYKDHAKYRIEEVPVMNSIGGKSDEGCSEHYNLRYVKLDKPIIPEHLELTELQKCIVYGEIINQPAFRKSYRR